MHMPDRMTGTYERVEVITSVQRRRRWTPEEKIRIVEETYLPGNTVSLVACRHGIAGNQLFTWRRRMAQGALTAATAARRSCQRQITAPWKHSCASFSACWARRRWKTNCCERLSPGPQAQKNGCCARPCGPRVDSERGCRCRRRDTSASVSDATAGRTAASWTPAVA